MKKLFSILISIILLFSVCQVLVACETPDDSEPVYSTEFVYNDTHHWRQQIGGTEKIDVAEHLNTSGKCKYCDYYWDCPNLYYEKVNIDGVVGYEVAGYDDFINPQYLNVKVPEYHQEPGDEKALPVISIGIYALSNRANQEKCPVAITSVKLPNTLLRIQNYAFSKSNIKEIEIPDSVKGDLHYTFWECSELKRVVIGDGIERLLGYTFYQAVNVEEVVLGSSVREIKNTCFYLTQALKYIVLPESVASIPQRIYKVNGHVACSSELFTQMGNPDIFMNITKEYLDSVIKPKTPKEQLTESLVNKTYTGFYEGWSGSSKVYYKGEWHYDENGKPVADVNK